MDDNEKLLILEMQRRAELRLQAQLQLALAADSRALTFCGLCLTAGSLLFGLASSPYVAGFYGAAVSLFVAAAIVAFTARPVRWGAPGQPGNGYADDLKENRNFKAVVQEVVSHIDVQIDRNAKVLSTNATLLRIGAWLAVSSPVIGLAINGIACAALK